MTKEEIKKTKRIRYKLREKITNNINKNIFDVDTKNMVLEYHKLTDLLKNEGLNVSIKLDYLKLDYWDNIQTHQTHQIHQIRQTHQTQKYIISLAWTETNSNNISNIINTVKEYFNDIGIEEIDYEKFNNGKETEHIIKYEFEGDNKSFKILKYSAQFLLDTISTSDYEKFNIAIYGKKKEL